MIVEPPLRAPDTSIGYRLTPVDSTPKFRQVDAWDKKIQKSGGIDSVQAHFILVSYAILTHYTLL
jgi:hypothetical protein